MNGITLDGITAFIEDNGGATKFVGQTLREICTKYIKPCTSSHKKSYCEHLLSSSSPGSSLPGSSSHVKPATVYIIHTWSYNFLKFLETLKTHFSTTNTVVFWIDLFSFPQHEVVVESPIWPFDIIKSIGRCAMVLQNWKEPIIFSRTWCLFEIYCACEGQSKVEMALDPKEKLSFEKLLISDFGLFDELISNVKVTTSDATKREDKEQILSILSMHTNHPTNHPSTSNRGHFSTINGIITTSIRDMVKRILETKVENIKKQYGNDHQNIIMPLNNLSYLHQQQGNHDLAMSLNMECVRISKHKLGEAHHVTLTVQQNLAKLYEATDRLEEAEALLIQLYDTLKIANSSVLEQDVSNVTTKVVKPAMSMAGGSNAVFLKCIQQLAWFYVRRKNVRKAEELFTEFISRNQVQPYTRDTLAAMQALADILYLHKDIVAKRQQAIPLLRTLIQERKVEAEEDALAHFKNKDMLSQCYLLDGEFALAEPLLQVLLDRSAFVSGENDPETLVAMTVLAGALENQVDECKTAKAESLYTDAFKLQQQMLGPTHPNTITTMSNVAGIFHRRGRIEEAESMYKDCLELSAEHLGEDNIHTLVTLDKYTELVVSNHDRVEEAEELCVRSLEIKKKVHGLRSPETQYALSTLAALYTRENKLDKAAIVLEQLMESSTLSNVSSMSTPTTKSASLESSSKSSEAVDKPSSAVDETLTNVDGKLEHTGNMSKEAHVSHSENGTKDDKFVQLHDIAGDVEPPSAAPDHRYSSEEITAMFNLAKIYHQQGRIQDAEKLVRKCLDSMESEGNFCNVEALDIIDLLAKVLISYATAEASDEAEKWMMVSLKNKRALLGDAHEECTNAAMILANLYQNQQKYSLSKPIYEDFLANHDPIKDWRAAQQARINISWAYIEEGNHSSATLLLSEALALNDVNISDMMSSMKIVDDVSDTSNMSDISVYIQRAQILSAQANIFALEQKDNLAEKTYGDCLALCLDQLGDTDMSTISVMHEIVRFYEDRGRLAEAQTLCEHCLSTYREAYGDNHKSTLEALCSLAIIHDMSENVNEAEILYRQCYDISHQLYGEGHTKTLTSMRNVGIILEKQNQSQDALDWFLACLELNRAYLGDSHSYTQYSLNRVTVLMLKKYAKQAQAPSDIWGDLLPGSFLDFKQSMGSTALHWSSENGYTDIVRLILQQGAEVNSQSRSGFTPLMFAAAGGLEDMLTLLLSEEDILLDLQNKNLWTALMLAVFNGHISTTKLLVQAGANVNLRNKGGQTALTLATLRGQRDIAAYLKAKST